MKKWLAVFTCGLLLSAGVCMSQAEGAGKDTLYEKGKEIAELVIDAVRSEDYVNLYSASEDVSNLLKEVGTAEWAEPRLCMRLRCLMHFIKLWMKLEL